MNIKKFLIHLTTQRENGQIGLLLTFLILTVLGVMGISFLYRMRLEQMAASNFQDSVKADYIAQAGIEKAIALLKNDLNEYDDLYEKWAKGFKETIKNENEDPSKNINEKGSKKEKEEKKDDRDNEVEVEIFDEASKININTAGTGSYNNGWSTYEIGLRALNGLTQKQVKAIIKYRYGEDGAPGIIGVDDDKDNPILECDGIDNDADEEIDEAGEGIDEPDEFCPEHPYGDDHPFDTMEEIRLVPGIGEKTFDKIKDFITIYSYDKDLDKEDKPRININ
ncbi:MAG: type II secretion system protein GspK, partial [Candidatus Aerophobetes bacterium]|nr:type II secretion system protein GspK [Candidatus Aerophobetes bacterium]